MNRYREAAREDGCLIPEAAKRLGLEPFSIHGLIHRRKLRADVAPFGELVIPQNELERVLSKPSLRQDQRARKE